MLCVHITYNKAEAVYNLTVKLMKSFDFQKKTVFETFNESLTSVNIYLRYVQIFIY